ncbi:unnamed protein product [Caenorhabditis auriculariae]|uniref:Amine oxidase domain-containing protein n=1 Tax=Caenorhabditis auriculariae TaxID=2777116 RepID=A0A8S1GUW6_9PELO|nr:unnamed protein product [Caenorhabditis auriculariae]
MSMNVRIVLMVIIGCGITVQRESEKGEPSIAIVGAGMAGLSTARRLLELGIDSFDIFEGLDRIGGRIHPVAYEDGYLQMGAQFINGAQNPLYKIAEKLDLLAEVVSDTAHVDKANYMHGQQKIDRNDIDAFLEFIKPLDHKYREIAKHNETVARRYSFKELFTLDYMRFLSENEISAGRRHVFDALARSFRSYWEFEWAADWSDLSVHVLREWDDQGPECESFATNKIGYRAILDEISRPIPSRAFHFNHTVDNIRISQLDGRIHVTTNRGLHPRVYDYIIVTSSLGVLKKYHHTMFTPPLARQKIEAIQKIGFGGSTKVFFEWENKFWPNDTYSIAPLPVKGMARDEVDIFEQETTILQTIDWAPNVLCGWYAGKGHAMVDNLSDEELSQKITRLLRDMYDDQDIEPPQKIIRSKLTKNELLLGSYSYMTPVQAMSRISHSQLAIPVKHSGRPRVLFAGEATHHRLFQTAIGAYLSGRREVDRALNDWNTFTRNATLSAIKKSGKASAADLSPSKISTSDIKTAVYNMIERETMQ